VAAWLEDRKGHFAVLTQRINNLDCSKTIYAYFSNVVKSTNYLLRRPSLTEDKQNGPITVFRHLCSCKKKQTNLCSLFILWHKCVIFFIPPRLRPRPLFLKTIKLLTQDLKIFPYRKNQASYAGFDQSCRNYVEKTLLIIDFLVKFTSSKIKIWNLALSKIRILRPFRYKKKSFLVLRLQFFKSFRLSKTETALAKTKTSKNGLKIKIGHKDYITA